MDMELVFGSPISELREGEITDSAVIYGTVGQSPTLDMLEESGKIDLTPIRGCWEVYSFTVVSQPLPGIVSAVVIAGSDRRGTIYGLYHLSELMGVSPFVNWNNARPERRDRILLDSSCSFVSKTPSVKRSAHKTVNSHNRLNRCVCSCILSCYVIMWNRTHLKIVIYRVDEPQRETEKI